MKPLITILSLLLTTTAARAVEPFEAVEEAILSLAKADPRNPVIRDAEWRQELTAGLLETSKNHGLDTLLLSVVTFCESSFEPGVIGKIGEKGLGQVIPMIQRQHACNMDSPYGELECAARHLAWCYKQCHSDYGALTLYATGKRCTSEEGSLTDRKIKFRLHLYAKLKALR